MITRFAPSPTGFLHIGGLYSALISERLAHQSEGKFYLRIEDTDRKRHVDGATDLIINSMHYFGINFDGEPIFQSRRLDIYTKYINELLTKGLVYKCFATKEELEKLGDEQKKQKVRPGYWGKWAIWRNKTEKEVQKALDEGRPYVIRLKSTGDFEKRVEIDDLFKGRLTLPQNDQDVVLIKSDGYPTYHFAHVVDDHLMETTHVVRADEWLPSITLHLELFECFGWLPPTYGHFAPIQKLDGNARRKLSKRKDPEASVEFYRQAGYPTDGVMEYLLNLANSGFESWSRNNSAKRWEEYPVKVKELQHGAGMLLDLVKLENISKNFVAKLSADKIYNLALDWASDYDKELAKLMREQKDYTISIFNIEREGGKPRKDIAKWADIREIVGYFFDEIYDKRELNEGEVDKAAIEIFLKNFTLPSSKEDWVEYLKSVCQKLSLALSLKDFQQDPEKYKGHIGDLAKNIRIALTGRNISPDLCEVVKVMGEQRVIFRLKASML